MFHVLIFLFICFMGIVFVSTCSAARIKDLAAIKGIRSNQLTGYGLVVGLNGTGDKDGVSFTKQALANMMEKMNIFVDKTQLKVKNIAAVMVTANIPPFARIGDKIDVTASSLGDAKSLKGGTLLVTPLKGVDGRIYALAQGPVSLAMSSSAGDRGSHLQVARIVNGASVEQEIAFKLDGKRELILSLFRPDFTTAKRMTDTINISIGEGVAKTIDSSALSLRVPDNMWQKNVAEFIADIETLSVIPDTIAKVVINEKTGTIVIGSDVTISSVAIAHGDLSVTINNNPENKESVMNLPGTSTIGELVRGLNSLGVKPQDLISILQSIKAAGALQAELDII
ncbi:MAG: flagellar basal body P-ring protein FlgI [Proteobacteria bacterium]|nr:flagellar basal body P-ring protein FlgI [Pseudomonadota bacterium]MBU1581177.1 flagellar basal body P-ring protein FlgI [Pseudomonadota bacterium]MBU2454580.1 flagellar basal body P-ring protein FlgI [Pseudomonadota bacterium]MBU2629858.1 flagellar basal body P-ring protein FlgI [Pseudomonadota bacterium]